MRGAGDDDASRVARVWELVSAQAASRRDRASVSDVCAAAVTSLGVSGAWVTAGDGTKPGLTICATDVVSESLAEVQITLGEGPCYDAALYGAPVLAVNLADGDNGHRWAMFADAALRAGATAVFAIPLRIGAIRVGVLGLYRRVEGPLDTFQLGDALILADTAMMLMVDAEARHTDGPLDGTGPASQSPGLAAHHAEIAQATGMLTEQLGVGITEAFARLRAYAYAQDMRLSEVAHDIVTRRLRLDPDPPGDGAR
ncbi:MAG: GAF and ANTAR domain-containing protein [Streptosporangiaceae bacterium]